MSEHPDPGASGHPPVDAPLAAWLHGLRSAAVGVVHTLRQLGRALAGAVSALAHRRLGEAATHLGSGAIAVLQLPTDSLLMIAGSTVSAVQTLAGLEPRGRRLRDDEAALLRRVFGGGLDIAPLRVKEGRAGLLTLPGRAFTLGDTIFVPPGRALTPSLLVHEATHVWQHQHHGTAYLSAALWAQYLGDGYDYLRALRRGRAWTRWNPEQQAQLLDDACAAGCLEGNAFRRGEDDLAATVAEALAAVRSARA